MATSASDKLSQLLRDVLTDANSDPEAHDALKRIVADAPVVARAIGKAITPGRALALTSALGTLLLQRGTK